MKEESTEVYLKIENLEIPEKNLRGIVRDALSLDLLFDGRAVEKEGQEIVRKLQEFEIGQIVEVVFETALTPRKEEIMKIKRIETPEPKMVAPVIYRFSGALEEIK